MKLTELACRKAPQKEKAYRMSDGDWLYLEVPPKGNKRWIIRYQFDGKENCLGLGRYPRVGLKEARKLRDQQQEIHAKGINPIHQRRIDKLEKIESNQNTFESASKEWFNIRKSEWSESHEKNVLGILRRNLHPYIGRIPIKQITMPVLLKALREFADEGKVETAKKAKQIAGQVFRYSIEMGWVEHDITSNLRKALPTPQTQHRPAITDHKKVGPLMLSIHAYKGTPQVCYALRLLSLTFVRPGELRHAEWTEVDLVEATWTIKGDKMKMGKDHIVPLSEQALKVLHDILPHTKNCDYIFPSANDPKEPMSENAMNKALKRLGYKGQHCAHGFRAMARTLLRERLEKPIDWIEAQLSHTIGPYDRAIYLDNRIKMMQDWANYLDYLRAEAEEKSKIAS